MQNNNKHNNKSNHRGKTSGASRVVLADGKIMDVIYYKTCTMCEKEVDETVMKLNTGMREVWICKDYINVMLAELVR